MMRQQSGEGRRKIEPGGEFGAGVALVLVGHGSLLNADSAAPIYIHADLLRSQGWFGQVVTGFWKQEPYLSGVLREVRLPRAIVVPVFISEGFFTRQVVPAEMGFSEPAELQTPYLKVVSGIEICYAPPVGTHQRMGEVILTRARECLSNTSVVPRPDPLRTTLVVAGHGTPADPHSREAIEMQVETIRGRGRYGEVHAALLEEPPRISECLPLATHRNVILVPYFISEGYHVRESIPEALGLSAGVVAARRRAGEPTWRNPTEICGHRVWCAASVGTHPAVVDVILERAREAAARGRS